MGVYTLEDDCRAERWELHWCDAVLQAGPDIMYALPHPPGCIARPNAQCCWIELFEHVPIIPLCKHCSTRTRLPASMPVGVGRKAALMQGGLMRCKLHPWLPSCWRCSTLPNRFTAQEPGLL